MIAELSSKAKVVGVKQSRRAIAEGRAKRVFFACDADPALLAPLRALCGEIPTVDDYTMAQLGSACGIAVGAAVVAELKE